MYGSKRAIEDIDILLSDKHFNYLIKILKNHLIKKPTLCKDAGTQFEYALLKYKGQEIELINQDNTKFYNPKTKKWKSECSKFNI